MVAVANQARPGAGRLRTPRLMWHAVRPARTGPHGQGGHDLTVGSGEAQPTRPVSARTNVERSASTREKIINAVIAILVESGYSSLTNAQITLRAGISSGALMHHFPSRTDLLVACVETAYARLCAFRERQLSRLDPGLPRFRAIIDLAWATARIPEGVACNEVRIGARSDPDLASATSAALTRIADDYGRFVGRLIRQAGLEATHELQGLSSTTAMAVRSLAIDQHTYSNGQMVDNILVSLRTLREQLIMAQLGPGAGQDPRIAFVAVEDAPLQAD